MRCRQCFCYQYDFISDIYDRNCSFCGLHGCCEVDPEGPQLDLDNYGSCGFIPLIEYEQLSLFDNVC